MFYSFFILVNRINVITCLTSIIFLGESEKRNDKNRIDAAFDLIDFNKVGSISLDEFVSKYFP